LRTSPRPNVLPSLPMGTADDCRSAVFDSHSAAIRRANPDRAAPRSSPCHIMDAQRLV
jgi:hypothetical protein